jgi:hypothetical protein
LDPSRTLSYSNLIYAYTNVNRLKDARATAEEALQKKLDSSRLRGDLYQVAFLQNDSAAMAEQVEWATAQPDSDDAMLGSQAETAAYFGELKKAREFSVVVPFDFHRDSNRAPIGVDWSHGEQRVGKRVPKSAPEGART